MAIDTKHFGNILRPGLAKVFVKSWGPYPIDGWTCAKPCGYEHSDGEYYKWEPSWFASYRKALKAAGWRKKMPENESTADIPF